MALTLSSSLWSYNFLLVRGCVSAAPVDVDVDVDANADADADLDPDAGAGAGADADAECERLRGSADDAAGKEGADDFPFSLLCAGSLGLLSDFRLVES